jgi:hypothetical protein
MSALKTIATPGQAEAQFTADTLYDRVYEPMGILNAQQWHAALVETSRTNGGVNNYLLISKDMVGYVVDMLSHPDAAKTIAARTIVPRRQFQHAVLVNRVRAGIRRQLPVFQTVQNGVNRGHNRTGWIFDEAARPPQMQRLADLYARQHGGRRFNEAEINLRLNRPIVLVPQLAAA